MVFGRRSEQGLLFSGKIVSWKKPWCFGSAFLARAFVFWEKHDLEEVVVSGSTFLAGAFVFWEKHDLKEAVVFGQWLLFSEKNMSFGAQFGALLGSIWCPC